MRAGSEAQPQGFSGDRCRVGLSGDPKEIRPIRVTLLKRALFLLVVGIPYYSIWPADILRFYGVYMAIGVVFLAAPTRRVFVAAGGLIGGSLCFSYSSITRPRATSKP